MTEAAPDQAPAANPPLGQWTVEVGADPFDARLRVSDPMAPDRHITVLIDDALLDALGRVAAQQEPYPDGEDDGEDLDDIEDGEDLDDSGEDDFDEDDGAGDLDIHQPQGKVASFVSTVLGTRFTKRLSDKPEDQKALAAGAAVFILLMILFSFFS